MTWLPLLADATDPASWAQLLKELGVPAAFLIALCLAIWKISTWAGANVVTPLVESHKTFLSATQAALTKSGEILDANGERLDELKQSAKEQSGILAELHSQSKEHTDVLRRWAVKNA